MMTYHHIKSGSKRLSGSEDTIQKLSGSEDTIQKLSGSEDTIQKLSGSEDTIQKLSGSEDTIQKLSGYHPNNWSFQRFAVTLTLAIQYFHWTL